MNKHKIQISVIIASIPSLEGWRGMPKRELDPVMPPEAIDANIVSPDDYWLPPRAAAAIVGLSEKWLANAREGRSNVEGPPFRKLGAGRTSPVRYNLGRLKEWIEQFPEMVDLAGRQPSIRSFAEFQDLAGTGIRAIEERWLFALPTQGKPVDFFEALKQSMVDGKPAPRYEWLTLPTFVQMRRRAE